ncbi:MAG: hypothetical protein HY287_08100 [Planctomycetes bacterium]|nr:hypothetical protein [Planctomycetota bacterium]
MYHHAKFAAIRRFRSLGEFLRKGCLAAVCVACQAAVAQTPTENPPPAPQQPQQPPMGEPIRPRVPAKAPNRNNPPQNPANPSNPEPNNAATGQPAGNPPTPTIPATTQPQPGAAGAAQPNPTTPGQPATQPLAPGQTGAAPPNAGQLPILNQPGAPPVIPGAPTNPQGAKTRQGAAAPGAPNPTAPVQPADDETVRKTREALTQPAAAEPPTGDDANKPATPDDSKKTPAQRAAERRKQMQGKTGDTAAGNPAAVPNPAVNPGLAGGEGDNPDAGPTKSINIPPAIADDVPPEKKTYSFSIKDGSYEQLVEGFARQTGMGVIGDIPKEGKVTFVTTESLSFDAALARIRMLLFNYKPHEPYWILREDTNLKVVRINDIYRVLPPDRMFRSVDAYKTAALGKDDLALVIYTPKSGSIADLRQVRDFLPDYVRIAPVENSNSVSIFALVSDIDKYLWLIDFFSNKEADPRTLVRIEVKHVAPSEALTRLSQFMNLDASGVPKAPPAAGRRVAGNPAQPSAIDTMPEPAVTVVPDDSQGILLVRAMQDKIDEIKFLLTYIDVEPSAETFKPTIIKLSNADAETVISAVQQVLQASIPTAAPLAAPNPAAKANKVKRPRAGNPAMADEGQIHMFAHPTDNAIVVLADEAGVQQVRELIPLFDIKTRADWVRLPLENIDAAEASSTITSVLIGMGGGRQGTKAQPNTERFQLVIDPKGGALWFSGEQKDLDQVREVLKTIDVREDPVKIHTVILRRQSPSFIASMLREMDQNGSGGGATPNVGNTKKSKKQSAGASAAVTASKFTADDGQKKLYVLCTEKEWQKYQPMIDQLENQKDEGPQYIRIAMKNIEPQDAVNKIADMLSAANEDVVSMVPADGSILVFDTDPRTIDRLNLFLGEIDKPSSIVERTFEIRHANPTDIKTAIETLVGEAPSSKAPKPRKNRDKQQGGGATMEASVTEELTVLQVGERLVVRTSPLKMERVAKIVEQFDVLDSRTEMKVYSDFPRGTDIAGIAETIRGVISGGTKPSGKRNKEGVVAGGIEGPQFIPQPSAGKLIVIAEPSQFAEVEKLLNVLRSGVEAAPPVVEFIELKYTDPAELVDAISPLVEIKVRQLVASGDLPDENADDSVQKPTKKKGSTTRFGEGSGGSGNGRYHIAPDGRNNRIVVAAPQVVVNEVRELVTQFDRPDQEKATPVFKTVELMNASPSEIVKAIGEMRGHGSATTKGGKTKRGDAGDSSSKSSVPFVIMEAPGGGSKIILQGTSEEVDQATNWIKKLDAEAATGRTIKVYEPKHAEIGKIVDFIISVVEATSGKGGPGGGNGKPAKSGSKKKDSAKDTDSEEDSGFTTTRTYFGKDLYLQADLIGGKFMVAATAAKIRQIDDVMKQLDTDEEAIVGITGPQKDIPTLIYELKHRKADSAVTDLDGLLHDRWPDDKEPPEVHAGSIGETLIVRYPKEDRFPEIRKLIEELVDKESEESKKIERKALHVPEGADPVALARLLEAQNPHLNVKVDDNTPKDDDKKYTTIRRVMPKTEKSKPEKSSAVSPCVLPISLRRLATEATLISVTQPESEPEDDQPVDDMAPEPNEPVPQLPPAVSPAKSKQPEGVPGDVLKRAGFPVSGKSKKDSQESKGADSKDSDTKSTSSEKKADKKKSKKSNTETKDSDKDKEKSLSEEKSGKGLSVHVNPDGSVILEGTDAAIKEAQDWLKDLDKETLAATKQEVRIYQLQYIDVNSAARVIEEMFNATSAQRNALAAAEMARRQQAAAAARQQPGQGQPGQEDPNNPQNARGRGRQPQQPVAQPQMPMAQLPPSTVRVFANTRDRSLILKADTSLYPQILELLATIDQPKPIDSVLRTYPLQKLNAAEVEDWLKHMLGLKEAGAARSRTPARTSPSAGAQGAMPGMGSTGPLITDEGGSLPQTTLQETASGNKLNIDPDDITLFSSDAGNAIMVMAPEAAQDYIKRLIEQLESSNIPERVTKVYELKNAEAEDMADYLASYFAEKLGTPGVKGKRPAGSESASSAGSHFTNTPTFVAYSRLNQLTVHATEKQMKEIDEIVDRTDVIGGDNQWQDVALKYADAGQVAEILANMFGSGGGKGGRPGGAPSADKGNSAAKFVGDPGGHVLYFTAPMQLHEQILAKIQKVDEEARGIGTLRVVQLKYATPSAIAEAIESALTGQKARGKSGGAIPGSNQGGGSSKSSGGAQFSVVGHDASKQLFITADDPTFEKIRSLIAKLDQPGMASTVEFRIYPLQYANAKSVHGQMTKLLGDYIKRLAPGEKPQGLEAFSVEPDETSNSLVVLGSPTVFGFIEENLRKIDVPGAVVGKPKMATFTINNGNASDIVQNIKAMYANKDQSPGALPAPIAEANTTSNVVIVHGTQSQIDEIKRDIIDPLDGPNTQRVSVKPIKLKFADPNATADAINKMFKSDSRNARDQVNATGDYTSNSVLVSASPENIRRVEDLIAQIDNAETAQQDVHVVEIKHTDASAVAQTLNDIFVKSGQTKGPGAQGSLITIAAVQGSRSVLIKCKADEFAKISETIKELDSDDPNRVGDVRVVTLLYSDAAEVAKSLEAYLTNSTAAGGKGEKLIGGVRISAMPQSNSVMISAATEEVERLVEIVKGMDIAGEKGNIPQIIPLQYARVSQILPRVQEMFSMAGGVQGGFPGGGGTGQRFGNKNQPPPVIAADEASNVLIVRGTTADFEGISKLVAKLDTKELGDNKNVRIVAVKTGLNVTQLADTVETSMREIAQVNMTSGQMRGMAMPTLIATPDTRLNAIMLAGSPSLLASAEDLIHQIEAMGPAANKATVVVPITNYKVEEMQRLVDQLTAQSNRNRSGGGGRSTQSQPVNRPMPQPNRP